MNSEVSCLFVCFISALDAENELLVQEALERLMEGKIESLK